MKIDPHCQQRNCCALKVLVNDVKITLILLDVPPLGEGGIILLDLGLGHPDTLGHYDASLRGLFQTVQRLPTTLCFS